MKNIIILLSFLICSTTQIEAQDAHEFNDGAIFDFTSEAKIKRKEKLNDSPYALFGDNTTVLKTDHERNLDHSLKIPLLENDKQIGLFELNFQTGVATIKDTDNKVILSQVLTQEQTARFSTIDPLAEKYYSISPYTYCLNNPLRFTDPTGEFVVESYTDEQLDEMGLTRNDLKRFTTIVTNISNIVDDNVLDVIMNTTGLSKETILNDLIFGNGPTISIGNTLRGVPQGGESGITFTPEIIKHLASVPSEDRLNLAIQVLGTGLMVLHEYGHYGDQVTNNGNNSGQFHPINGDNYAAFFGGNNIEKGAQEWSMTKTGHRGTDIEMLGFGVSFAVSQNGKLIKSEGSFANLPQKANLNNILFTLSNPKKR